jgi:hypothetical protein
VHFSTIMLDEEIVAPNLFDEEIAILSHFIAECCYQRSYGCYENMSDKLILVRKARCDSVELQSLFDMIDDTNDAIINIERRRFYDRTI